MAKGRSNYFAEVTEEMILEKFLKWNVEALRTYYPSEIKTQIGNLRPWFTGWSWFFFLKIFFWSTWNR